MMNPIIKRGVTNASVQPKSNGQKSIFSLPETEKVKHILLFSPNALPDWTFSTEPSYAVVVCSK